MLLFDKRVPPVAKFLIVWCALYALINAYFAVAYHMGVGVLGMLVFAGLFLWYVHLAKRYTQEPLPVEDHKE